MTNWKIKPETSLNLDDFWYDITDGGYINPRNIISDPNQVRKLLEAIAIVKSFEDALAEHCE